jgi:hypothetical protein
MGIPGQIGFSQPYVVDLIHPDRRSMTWNCYDSSARYVTLLILGIIVSNWEGQNPRLYRASGFLMAAEGL